MLMQQLQATVEQQAQQMQQLAAENANLKEVKDAVLSTQGQRGAGGMYPSEAASDNAIPEEAP